jgi:hypothetical protein
MWTYLGKRIREGRSWKDSDGITHPTSWGRWSDAEKTSKGMVWVDPAPSFDNRFWWDASTPKALEDVNAVDEDGNPVLEDGEQMVILGLKSQWKATIKRQAGGLLEPTDWMVIKSSEVADYTVPADITTYRAAVRNASNSIEASIDGAADHTAFIALFNAPLDSEGVPTGNAPISNWPQEITQ